MISLILLLVTCHWQESVWPQSIYLCSQNEERVEHTSVSLKQHMENEVGMSETRKSDKEDCSNPSKMY